MQQKNRGSLLIAIIGTIFVTLSQLAAAAGGGVSCEHYLTSLSKANRAEFKRLIDAAKYQEAIWFLQDAGRRTEAEGLIRQVTQLLETAPASDPEIDEDFSNKGIANFEGGISAIVKIGADEPRCEVAFYRIDRLFGTNRVPITVLRLLNRKKASFQLWLKGLRQASDNGLDSSLFFLDFVAATTDRGGDNSVRLGRKKIAIDNAFTFRNRDASMRAIREEFLRTYAEWQASDFILPKDVLRQASAVSDEQIRQELKDLLSAGEIKAAIARKNFFISIQGELAANPRRTIGEIFPR